MKKNIQQLSYQELKVWQAANKEFLLIDVRELNEHTSYNIGGELIPLNILLQQADRLDINKPIVLYCKKGIRSQLAIQRLSPRLPAADFYNLEGGIWRLFHG